MGSTGSHRQDAGSAVSVDVMRRPMVRIMRAALWTGMVASGLWAEYLRTAWLGNVPLAASIPVALLFGLAGVGLCLAGLEAIRASARSEWRESGPVLLDGGAPEAGPDPSAAVDEALQRIAALELASEHSARTLSEVFDLMQAVCDVCDVDTGPAARTAPMLRLVPSGEAG